MAKTRVEITLPVYNEQLELAEHVEKLHEFCTKHLSSTDWHITIADNASTDETATIGGSLSNQYSRVDIVSLKQKGRGRAVKHIWQSREVDVYAYMDIDLSTDLKHLPDLISRAHNPRTIAIGSRLLPASRVINRTPKREVISRAYNMLIRLFFSISFSDAQCGFKAVDASVVRDLIPHVKDDEWFMDSELLIVGEKAGYHIVEIPVVWRDNPGSTVRVLPTAMGDLQGLYRLFKTRPWKRVAI